MLHIKEKDIPEGKCYPCYCAKSCKSSIKVLGFQIPSKVQEGGKKSTLKRVPETTRGAMHEKTSHTDHSVSQVLTAAEYIILLVICFSSILVTWPKP